MSKKTRTLPPPEQVIAAPIVFDNSYMVCLRSADDRLFLVDRNCAMVSAVIRNSMWKGRRNSNGTSTSSVTTPQNTPVVTTIGAEKYETITLDEVGGDLLELALEAMYFKYRYDGDPERRPLEPQHSPEDRHKLAALSALLDM
ncbi:hypothetical protein TraAM80_07167 [Trypanosoma rangeli]|uniref:Elongin-C n=1 Tax=Trypanosoma rangeli TaxID=5698 RepID=A0A422N6R1_TRYRA|nr:uncharacterized protein TraAM80_07167 [Trypanosoma rangeli]RNF01168.1 hypothetical protein TraAM80_07167 [Trypanosoma rangeli]|eukprot:RNF01168.1 hypothetical protein TraAM80_07167 [Trypanosoma rangeli]